MINHLHIGEASDEHHPLLVSRELVKEGAMGDPEVLQGGELPQLVHLGPVLDLGGGDVERVEAGGEFRKSLRGGKLGYWALGQRKELQPWKERESKEIHCAAEHGSLCVGYIELFWGRMHFAVHE